MININKLKAKIVEQGLSVSEVADKIGIDHSTFYRRLNNGGENFSVREVKKISKILDLSAVYSQLINQ